MKNVAEITGDTTERILECKTPLNAKRAKTLRNVTARKKLEMLREQKELRKWLADVWSEPGDRALTVYPDRSDEIVHSLLAA